MSTLIVEVCEILDVNQHPNADRLDIVKVKGWNVVAQKDSYKIGDKVIYVPIDSVLPLNLSDKMDVTKYLSKGRVKTTKLRGVYSQGLLIPMSFLDKDYDIGSDVKNILGITKYEPLIKVVMGGENSATNPNFIKYTNIENIKNFPNVLIENENVIITEKIHGTNFRVAKVDGELIVGSHNCQLKESLSNLYWRIAKQFNLDKILQNGEQLFGEIYGNGIQKLKYDENKPTVRFFDLMRNLEYVDYVEFEKFCISKKLPIVPLLYRGRWNNDLLNLANGRSIIANHIREGFVVKPEHERLDDKCNRVIFKHISEKYLTKNYD